MGRGGVGHDSRDVGGIDTSDARSHVILSLVECLGRVTEAGAEHDPAPRDVQRGPIQPGVVPCLQRGAERELRAVTEPGELLARGQGARVEATDFSRDPGAASRRLQPWRPMHGTPARHE
jgi:hypothetical protein